MLFTCASLIRFFSVNNCQAVCFPRAISLLCFIPSPRRGYLFVETSSFLIDMMNTNRRDETREKEQTINEASVNQAGPQRDFSSCKSSFDRITCRTRYQHLPVVVVARIDVVSDVSRARPMKRERTLTSRAIIDPRADSAIETRQRDAHVTVGNTPSCSAHLRPIDYFDIR